MGKERDILIFRSAGEYSKFLQSVEKILLDIGQEKMIKTGRVFMILL